MLLAICWKVVNWVTITDVRIRKIGSEGKMKAVASVTDNEFIVDIKVIEGQSGLFIAMPTERPGWEYRDIAAINSARGETQKLVLESILEWKKNDVKGGNSL